jgi:selenide,water dikinase
LAEEGCVPGGSRRNLEYLEPATRWPGSLGEPEKLLLCDAQTSGGLLISVAAGDSRALVEALGDERHAAAEIGELISGVAGEIEVR